MSIRGSIIVAMAASLGAGMVPVAGQTASPVLAPVGRVMASQPAQAILPEPVSSTATRPARVSAGPSRLTSRPAALPTATQPATLRVDAPKYDFGKIWDSDTVTHTFELLNTGTRAVTIANVRSSCGCTTTDKWEKQVAPGEVWKLPVKFVAANRHGKTSKSITVDTDDPGARLVTFLLEGEVNPRFEMSPTQGVNFGTLRQDSQVKKSLRIASKSDEAVTIRNAKADTDLLKVSLRDIEAGRTYELDVETVPPLKVNSIRSKIVLETSLKEQPEVVVYANGYVQPRIVLMPQVVMIPQVEDKLQRRRLVLKASEEVTFHVKEVKASNAKIGVKTETVREGKEYQIWLTVPADVSLPSTGETVTVTTDDAEMPTVTARLQAYSAGRSPRHARHGDHAKPRYDLTAEDAVVPEPAGCFGFLRARRIAAAPRCAVRATAWRSNVGGRRAGGSGLEFIGQGAKPAGVEHPPQADQYGLGGVVAEAGGTGGARPLDYPAGQGVR